MSKKGVSIVAGNTSPKVGEKSIYNVAGWYPGTLEESKDLSKVTWELFKKRKNGRFTSTNIKKVGDNSFIFGKTAHGSTFRLEAYVYQPEGGGLIITPQQGAVPKINKVVLNYVDDTPGTTFSFMEKLRAKANCTNMERKEVLFTLWEDDAIGDKHNPSNLAIDIQKARVGKNGQAVVDFSLTKALMQKAIKGEKDDVKLEFYVTAEYYRVKREDSNNVDIANPLKSQGTTTPAKKTAIPKAKSSPAAKKAVSKKEEKGIVATVTSTLSELWDWGESVGTAIKDKLPTIQMPDGTTTTKVGTIDGPDKKEEKGVCVCKQKENQFYWSNVLTCKERKKVLLVCKNIWPSSKPNEKASELMAIMHLETIKSFSPSKKGISENGTKFIGLIQFSAKTARGLGTSYEALGKMTFIEQMDFVEKYLKQSKGKMNTIVDFYLQVIKPADVGMGKNPDHIVFDESVSVPDGDGRNTSQDQRTINIEREPWVTKYGYASNPTFMTEKNEKIKRARWVYTRQRYEDRYGTIGGKTTIKEIEDVLKNEHYKPGATQLFNGNCEDIVVENKEATDSKRAPWMEIAVTTAKKMRGCVESTEPMYSNAKKYLKYCENNFEPTDGVNGPWCAAFMNWCIGQTKNSKTKAIYNHANSAASLAPIDAKLGLKYKPIKEPIYGCIVVYKHNTKWKGHTGFLYGKTKGGEYILLGGNQDNTIRFDSYGEYTSKTKTKKLYGFYIPKDYEVTAEDNLKSTDIYENEDTLNLKFGIITGKATGKTN